MKTDPTPNELVALRLFAELATIVAGAKLRQRLADAGRQVKPSQRLEAVELVAAVDRWLGGDL